MTEQQHSQHWGTFLFGLIFGWGIGIVIGILKAPRSGEETLALLAEQSNEIVIQIQQQLQRDPVQEAIEEGQEIAHERMAARETAASGPEAEAGA